ncbi:unnamed protein product [Nyctereutes procyonoides]|uniref:(raccoon dog) hypothetical protein n=1 Tax=Nyctereutes procyonoides TaxID=34880 RepID=A0A811ZRW1_NYCPR|nr:unnamed protein product [Nyctereutes procyonoides]
MPRDESGSGVVLGVLVLGDQLGTNKGKGEERRCLRGAGLLTRDTRSSSSLDRNPARHYCVQFKECSTCQRSQCALVVEMGWTPEPWEFPLRSASVSKAEELGVSKRGEELGPVGRSCLCCRTEDSGFLLAVNWRSPSAPGAPCHMSFPNLATDFIKPARRVPEVSLSARWNLTHRGDHIGVTSKRHILLVRKQVTGFANTQGRGLYRV